MGDYPPCPASGPITGCCTVAIPNTSQFSVVCPGIATQTAQVPTLSYVSMGLFAVLIVIAAFRRIG